MTMISIAYVLVGLCSMTGGTSAPPAPVAVSGFDLLDIARLPAFADRCLRRAVEPQNREVALAGRGREPVGFLAGRRLRSEVEIDAAVGILHRLVTRTQRRKRLAVGETRSV